MDRNTVTGFLLILAILIAYSVYNYQTMPPPPEQDERTVQTDPTLPPSAEPADTQYAPPALSPSDDTSALYQDPADLRTERLRQDFGPFATAAEGTEETFTLENELMILNISSKGGKVESVILKEYVDDWGEPLILFDGDEDRFGFQFFSSQNREIRTEELFFTPEGTTTGNTIALRANVEGGGYFEQVYTLEPETFLVGYQVNMVGMSEVIPRNINYINLYWSRMLRTLENDFESAQRYSGIYYKFRNENADYLSESGVEHVQLEASAHWISYKQRFFNSTLIAEEGLPEGDVKTATSEEPGFLKKLESSFALPYQHGRDNLYSFQYFFGPNHYQTLRKVDAGLDDIIPLGPGFFLFAWVKWFNRFLIIPIFNFLDNYIGNYGIIILILTFLIKLLLFPLTYKSYLSTAKMKVLQPEINELKEKYKDDQQKIGTEQWKLFQSAGVNPMGGCLPMLLQMPILIAMYYFFPTSFELRQEPFLWAHDLSTFDSIYDLPFYVPLYGDHISLFTLLMTVTSILYATTQTQMTTGPAAQLKWMPYIFPIMLLGIFNNFPAALTYYFFLSNLITYGQQFFIKKFIVDEDKLHQQMQERKKKPVKKSGFQKRLEDLAKQQQEAQRQKQQKKSLGQKPQTKKPK